MSVMCYWRCEFKLLKMYNKKPHLFSLRLISSMLPFQASTSAPTLPELLVLGKILKIKPS